MTRLTPKKYISILAVETNSSLSKDINKLLIVVMQYWNVK